MSAALPGWVYELVCALVEHEQSHNEEDACFAAVLHEVPYNVRCLVEAAVDREHSLE